MKIKTRSCEDQATRFNASRNRLQSEKDRRANQLNARIKTLEEEVKAAPKKLDTHGQDSESAKRRKMDHNWRHDGSYYHVNHA